MGERDPAKRASLGTPYLTMVTGEHPEVTLFEPDVFYPKVPFGPVNAWSVPAETYACHHASGRWWPGSYRQIQGAAGDGLPLPAKAGSPRPVI
jgi:hypothetical protein